MIATAIQALQSGAAYLVDENGARLSGSPAEQLEVGTCWAHLRDGSTGQWHVHQFSHASELNTPRILEMLLPFPTAENGINV